MKSLRKIKSRLKNESRKWFEKIGKIVSKTRFSEFSVMSKIYYNIRSFLQEDSIIKENFRGFKIYIKPSDFIGWRIIKNKYHEKEILEFIESSVKEGDTVVEIGSHIGTQSLFIRKNIGLEGKLYAFEPDPKNREILNRNLKENGYKDVIVLEKAVSDKIEKRSMKHDPSNSGASHLVESNIEDERKTFVVETITLPRFIKEKDIENINLLKIDAEGEELKIIQNLIDENSLEIIESLLVELHKDKISKSRLKNIFSTLIERGCLYEISERGKEKITDLESFKDTHRFLWNKESKP